MGCSSLVTLCKIHNWGFSEQKAMEKWSTVSKNNSHLLFGPHHGNFSLIYIRFIVSIPIVYIYEAPTLCQKMPSTSHALWFYIKANVLILYKIQRTLKCKEVRWHMFFNYFCVKLHTPTSSTSLSLESQAKEFSESGLPTPVSTEQDFMFFSLSWAGVWGVPTSYYYFMHFRSIIVFPQLSPLHYSSKQE